LNSSAAASSLADGTALAGTAHFGALPAWGKDLILNRTSEIGHVGIDGL